MNDEPADNEVAHVEEETEAKAAHPDKIPGVRRNARVGIPKRSHISSMSRKRYAYAINEVATQEVRRTVAGGNKTSDYIPKEDVSSPTAATETVLLTCIVDAEEERDVAVINIPNTFIQTQVEEDRDMAFIKIRGFLVDMIMDIASEVDKPYETMNKRGVKQLVVQCQNAIYGTTMASLLANKMNKGKQMMMCFHMNDCRLSHHKCRVVDQMIAWLRQVNESISKDRSEQMKVSRKQGPEVSRNDFGLQHSWSSEDHKKQFR